MKKHLLPMTIFAIFETVAITFRLTKDNVFYLFNFSYIGFSTAPGILVLLVYGCIQSSDHPLCGCENIRPTYFWKRMVRLRLPDGNGACSIAQSEFLWRLFLKITERFENTYVRFECVKNCHKKAL